MGRTSTSSYTSTPEHRHGRAACHIGVEPDIRREPRRTPVWESLQALCVLEQLAKAEDKELAEAARDAIARISGKAR